MFSKNKESLVLVRYSETGESEKIDLNKSKLLLGSGESCDIVLDDNKISHYHALLSLNGDVLTVIDMDSANGVYQNGQRFEKAIINPGDRIQFADIEYLVEALETEESVVIENIDNNLTQIATTAIEDAMPSNMPPMPGMVVIDGEYCNIKFDENKYEPINIFKEINQYAGIDYVDTHEKVQEEEIIQEQVGTSIEIAVLSNGVIITHEFLSLENDPNYFLSAYPIKDNEIELPTLEANHQFISVTGGQIQIFDIPEFEKSHFSGACSGNLDKDDIYSYHAGSVQVLVRISNRPPSIKPAPFFGKDREFQKETGKIVGTLMGLMLLLLFVDTNVPEKKEKKIAVIYRKAVKSKVVSNTKSSSDPSNMNKDKGVMKKDHKSQEIKKARASAEKPNPKQSQAAPKKMAAANQPKVKNKPKMKAYKFKMNNSLSSFLSNNSSKVSKNIKAQRSVASVNVGDSSTPSKKNFNKVSGGAIGTLGDSSNGQYDSSSGAKGLASKGGIDTTYSAPKTVVLGSMDPELLRKILQEYLPQFRHCYQQELAKADDIKGVLDLNFRIMKNGSVAKIDIKAKDSRFSNQGINCMAGVLKVIDFPKPKGGGIVDVRQPLNFFAEKSKI